MYAPQPRLYYSASARLSGLRKDIQNRRLTTYPTEAPHSLLNVLDKACRRLESLVEILRSDWERGVKDKASIEQAFGFLHDSIGAIGEYLSIFETAGFEKARPEIALPLEILVNEHIPVSRERGHQFIFHATYELNFYYRHFYRELRRHLFFVDEAESNKFFQGLPEHVALVALAALERENIFTLIILLHELAHYYDRSQDRPLSQMDMPQSVERNALKQWVAEAKDIKFIPDILRRRVKRFEDIPSDVLDFFLSYAITIRVDAAQTWLRELTADLVATRIGGVAFALTLKKFLSFFHFEPGGEYPPNYRRFHAVAQVLLDPNEGIERQLNVANLCGRYPEFRDTIEAVLAELRAEFKAGDVHVEVARPKPRADAPMEEKESYLEYLALRIIEQMLEEPLRRVWEQIKRDFPEERCCRLSERILDAAMCLIERMPPSQLQGEQLFEPANWIRVQEALCGAWLAWLHEEAVEERKHRDVGEQTQSQEERTERWIRRRSVTSRLTLRGIELGDYLRRHATEATPEERQAVEARLKKTREEVGGLPEDRLGARSGAGVLNRRDLLAAMAKRPIPDRLVVMPLLDPEQIGEASVDLRLGNGFVVVRRAQTPKIQVTPGRIVAPGELKELIVMPYGKQIVLHAGEFMLGSTLEYICVPRDMMAYVIGRSSLGRLGLIIAMATHVAPGYKGTLTLELSNVGTVPIELEPRILIAQLVFHWLREPVAVPYHERGRFAYSTGPDMPPLSYS